MCWGGGGLLHKVGRGLFHPTQIGSDRPNLSVHLGLQQCRAQARGDGQHLAVRRLSLRMPRLRPD